MGQPEFFTHGYSKWTVFQICRNRTFGQGKTYLETFQGFLMPRLQART